MILPPLAATLTGQAQAPDLAEYRRLVGSGRETDVLQALALVARRIEGDLHTSSAAGRGGADAIAERAVRPFLTRGSTAKGSPTPTDLGALQARAGRGADGFDAVWVAAGRTTRFFVFNRGRSVGTFAFTPYFGAVVPLAWRPGVFLAHGLGIQDAGVKSGKKVWLVSGNIPPSRPEVVVQGLWSLDSKLAGLEVRNGRILVRSLDDPRGFLVASPTSVLLRTTAITPGGTISTAGDGALRAVDAFMTAAYAAKTPTALQKRLRSLAPSPPFVEPRVAGATVILDGDVRLVFTLAKGGGRLHVIAVRKSGGKT